MGELDNAAAEDRPLNQYLYIAVQDHGPNEPISFERAFVEAQDEGSAYVAGGRTIYGRILNDWVIPIADILEAKRRFDGELVP